MGIIDQSEWPDAITVDGTRYEVISRSAPGQPLRARIAVIKASMAAMVLEAHEAAESGALNQDQDPYSARAVQQWIASGTTNEIDAWNAVFLAAPLTFAGIPRFSISQARLEPPQVWRSQVVFSNQKPREEDTNEWEFDVGHQLTHIDTGVSFTGYTAAGAGQPDLPDLNGFINVRDDGTVDGLQHPVGTLNFRLNRTWKLSSLGSFTAYAKTVRGIVGRANAGTFQGFDPGEVRFLGMHGRERNRQVIDLSYHFEVGENQTGIVVDGITFDSDAWEYHWIRVEKVADDTPGAEVLQPKARAVYNHVLATPADFSLLGIGV